MIRITAIARNCLLWFFLPCALIAQDQYSPEAEARKDRIVERSEDLFIKSLLPEEVSELRAAQKTNIDQLILALRGIDTQIAWITQNLENISTPSYKRIVTLRDFPIVKDAAKLAILPERDFGQGALATTTNKFDIAITGPGLFKLQDSQGFILYRRWGSFRMNKDRLIEDLRGNTLIPKIRIPEQIEIDTFSVTDKGQVSVTDTNGKKIQIGSLILYEPENISKMPYIRECNCFSSGFKVSDKSSEADHSPVAWSVAQGFIEMSNSDPNDERTSLIVLLRHRRALIRALKLLQAGHSAK